MNVIDLFAGAGGLSEGFRREEFNIVAHVEMDKWAATTLQTREIFYYLLEKDKLDIYKEYLMNNISREDLIKYIPNEILDRVICQEISEETLQNIIEQIDKLRNNKPIHVVIGGPPCQSFSVAGRARNKLKVEDDPRTYLYKYYIKILEIYKPKVFVFENVRGILSAKNGQIFKQIKKEMLMCGYNIEYKILNAKDFGVIQSRERVILIGWKSDIEFSYPIFTAEEQKWTIKDLFDDLPFINAGEKIEDYKYTSGINECLTELKIRNKDDILIQHEARPHRDIDLEIYKTCVDIWNEEKRKLKYNELPEYLIKHKNTKSFLDRFKVVPYNDISHTIVAHISKDGHYYIHPDILQNRSLSIREAARIQSFPDSYYFEGGRTAAFRQIGNAVPPLMAEKIAEKIKEALTIIFR
ncbi:DNA cytosine methyltransferase [Sporanaerobacter acetigenes]|uniref:DNA (cytosine-5-)-methyltransferase n=1 Tax=Sporanaerobacter acetigenes DSM 13106 TaxID=1123281 RepID=A0A1M5U6K1_9FIRM|nr:DNA cytosine methyltransferase [Sporanaerobacter acetigenes]SHH58558.1 DNA (cytosine-5)-methyltransferase 1 [Sporanaerobacter acetigenes DSM 13106]